MSSLAPKCQAWPRNVRLGPKMLGLAPKYQALLLHIRPCSDMSGLAKNVRTCPKRYQATPQNIRPCPKYQTLTRKIRPYLGTCYSPQSGWTGFCTKSGCTDFARPRWKAENGARAILRFDVRRAEAVQSLRFFVQNYFRRLRELTGASLL